MSVSMIQDHMRRKNEQSPQYDYLWRVELPSLTADSADPTSAKVTAQNGSGGLYGSIETGSKSFLDSTQSSQGVYAPNGMHDLNHRVYTIDVPFYSYDTHKANAAPGYFYTAHHRDIGTISITMDEYEDGKTLQYINDWTNLIKRMDGTYNPPAVYKKTIKYIRMSATKLDLHVSYYKGFFLNEVSPLNSSQEGDGIMQYSLTLTGDKVVHKIIPESEVIAKIEAAQYDILMEQISHSKFALGSLDGMTKSRAFDKIVDLF